MFQSIPAVEMAGFQTWKVLKKGGRVNGGGISISRRITTGGISGGSLNTIMQFYPYPFFFFNYILG